MYRLLLPIVLVGLFTNCSGIPTSGEGKKTYPNGGVYEGHFNFKLRNGQGTFTWPNGNKYSGTWVKDKISGQGTYSFSDGRSYSGKWENNNLSNGTIAYPDGTKYVGDLKNWQFQGQGKIMTPYYEWSGKFVNGIRSGPGTLTITAPNLDKIKILPINITGDWDYFSTKKAVATFPGGIKWTGSVKNGQLSKRGTIEYPDGSKLTENFELTHNITDLYKGLSLEAPEYRGFKLKNVRTGYGLWINPAKGVYQGGFYKGLFTGPGNMTQLNGERFTGFYKNGVLNGQGTVTYPDGGELFGNYSNNKRDGWFSKFDSKGTLVRYQQYNNGKAGRAYDLSSTENCKIENLIVNKSKNWRIPSSACDGSLKDKKSYGISADSLHLLSSATFKGGRLIAGKITPIQQVPNFYQGEVKNSIFKGTEFQKDAAVYSGTFSPTNRNGKGVCNWSGNFEPCEYKEGTRIDPIWIAREKERKERERLARCQNAISGMENAGRLLENNLRVTCGKEQQNASDAIQRFSRTDVSCKNCGRSSENALNDIWSCATRVKNSAREADNILNRSRNQLKTDNCGASNEVSSYSSSLSQLKSQVAENARRIESSASSMKSGLKSIYRQRNEVRAEQERQQFQAIVGAIQAAGQQMQANLRQQHQQQLSFMRQQKAWQSKVQANNKRLQQNSYASLQRQKQQFNYNNYRKTTAYKKANPVDPFIAAKKNCLARKGTWRGNACQTVTVIPWHGRACYDPTGKYCKTGETYRSKSYRAQNTQTASSGLSGSGSSANGGNRTAMNQQQKSGFGSGYSSGSYKPKKQTSFGEGSSSGGKKKDSCPENVTSTCLRHSSAITKDVLKVDHYQYTFQNTCSHKIRINWCYHIHGRSKGSCYGDHIDANSTKKKAFGRKTSGNGRYHVLAYKGVMGFDCSIDKMSPNHRNF